MKKRSLFLMVLAIFVAFALVGCGPKNNAANTADNGANNEAANHENNHNHNNEDHDHDHDHGDGDHAHGEFEWIGVYDLKAGEYLLHFGPCEDETMDLGVVKLGDNITDLEHHASHLMVIEDKEEVKQEGTFTAQPDYVYTLEMNPEHGHINFVIEEDGEYALVLEHDPSESNMQVFDKDEVEVLPKQEIKGHDHEH